MLKLQNQTLVKIIWYSTQITSLLSENDKVYEQNGTL